MQRIHDNGHTYKGTYEGWYCPRCADFKTEQEIGRGQHLPDPPDPARPRAGGELVLPAVAPSRSRSSALYAEQPDFVTPAPAPQRGARVHHRRAQRRLAQPLQAQADLGRRGPVGRRARLLRLVRRAAQLLHGARLRPRRRGPDRHVLAGDLPRHGQGHPQVPRGVLAGDADGRRAAAARAPVHPRLPADARRERRRDEDVQVARQRARPVRGDGPLRHRRAALLLLPRGLLRPGRRRLDDHVRRALRDRARQRVRQPRQPHAVDDQPLPRRRRARGRRRPGARPGLRRACATRSASLLDRAEITQALERIWQRVRRLNRYVEERAPWQLAKDEAQRAASSTPRCARSPRACASSACCSTPYIPESAGKLLAALGQRGRSRSTERGVRRGAGRRAGREARRRCSRSCRTDERP